MGLRGRGAIRRRPTKNELPNFRYRDREREEAERPKASWELLTGEQYWTLALGPRSDLPPAFESEEAERAAWLAHRDEMLRDWARPGHRPLLFWKYEHPEPPPRGAETESAHIYLAIADEAERIAIEKQWRHAVQYCLLHNPRDRAGARRLALSWGGVPRWAFTQICAELKRSAAATPPLAEVLRRARA